MRAEANASGVGLLLAGSACLLPFLVPYHQQPFLSFFPEWLAAGLGVAAALGVLAGRGPREPAPAPALWLSAFALFLALRATSGAPAYPQLSLLAALYVLYAVLMIWLGAQLASQFGPGKVAAVLSTFILIGALANAVAGVIQFHDRPALLEDLVAELRGTRVYGNIAQPNLYAEYLALGEGALLFQWVRGRAGTKLALAGLVLLAVGSALTSSRSALLYALWYPALAVVAGRVRDAVQTRRLRLGAWVIASTTIAAYLVVPWANSVLHSGPQFDRPLPSPGDYAEPRLGAFLLALRAFVAAPFLGTGIGEFAGRAYELGLDSALTRFGEVWTSPHNLVLHLLAETGLVGTLLGLGGLGVWGAQLLRRYRANPQLELWWFAAGTGVVLIHSAIEFPLWSAHFLGVTALLVGASSQSATDSRLQTRVARSGAAVLCVALSIALVILLRDYVRLDLARITGTRVTLAPAAQARRDADTMRELSAGLLAPLAERWIVQGAPLDKAQIAEKRAMSDRVARVWPSSPIVARRAVFLALAGRPAEARGALARALLAFPEQRRAIVLILQEAYPADPQAIGPLLALVQADSPA